MHRIWFNRGFSSVHDALVMIREAAGEQVTLLASHEDKGAPVLAAADITFAEPARSSASDYVDWCLGVCQQEQVDLFVPQAKRAAIAARAIDFEALGTRVAVPCDAETIDLIDDKARFYEAARAAGLPMPETFEISDAAAFDEAVKVLTAKGKQACVKPPHGVFAAGFWRLDGDRGVFDLLMDSDSRSISTATMRAAIAEAAPVRLLVLEYLAGPEWSLDCVCRDGRLVAGVARRKFGRAQALEVDGPVFEIGRAAIAAFGLSGLINLQVRAAESDGTDPRLLEINTRMSGGCLYTAASGVNLPWIHVALELGLIAEADVPVAAGGALVAATQGALVIAPADTPKVLVHA